MTRNLWYRALAIVAAVVLAATYLAPSVASGLPDWWSKVLPNDAIRLGLDLQGGMHLILEVQTEKALEFSVERMAEDLKRELTQRRIPASNVAREGSRSLRVRVPEGANGQEVIDAVKDRFPTLERVTGSARPDVLEFTIAANEIDRIETFAVEQSLETIRNRIDQLGLTEPIIQRSGADAILIQLPGETDPERAKAIIGKTAVPEFKLLADEKNVESVLGGDDPCRLRDPERGRALDRANERAGAALEVLCGVEGDPLSGRTRPVPYLVERKTLMTGEVITDARPRPDTQLPGNYLVSLDFNARGASLFEDITG
ncbi:MAG: SecDF P1 head subdomain-containing protein, partial [Candidatus Binatia bacterium]